MVSGFVVSGLLVSGCLVSGVLGSKKCYVFKGYFVHITKFRFHVFDRYEIHIQACVDFI